MMQVRPVFVREAALLLAELAQKAEAGEGFAVALDGEGEGRAWPGRSGPVASRHPQPDRAAGFLVHAAQPEGPERPAAPLALAAYAARLAERMVFEGPIASLSLRV